MTRDGLDPGPIHVASLVIVVSAVLVFVSRTNYTESHTDAAKRFTLATVVDVINNLRKCRNKISQKVRFSS